VVVDPGEEGFAMARFLARRKTWATADAGLVAGSGDQEKAQGPRAADYSVFSCRECPALSSYSACPPEAPTPNRRKAPHRGVALGPRDDGTAQRHEFTAPERDSSAPRMLWFECHRCCSYPGISSRFRPSSSPKPTD